MGTHIVIEGNSFYEIDEDCLRVKQERKKAAEKFSGGKYFQDASAENRNRERVSEEKEVRE